MALISADELAGRLDADPGSLRIADVRWYLKRPGDGRAAYAAGHIPGAIFVDLDDDLSDLDGLGSPGRHPLPSPAAFARTMGSLGIGSDHFVVAYDDAAAPSPRGCGGCSTTLATRAALPSSTVGSGRGPQPAGRSASRSPRIHLRNSSSPTLGRT
jgi:thiosulfate/3-mercaptopyruvate sulfurtransferase